MGLFARRETTLAGCGQAEFTEPSDCVAETDKALPVRLGNLPSGFALADLDQGGELVRAEDLGIICHDVTSSVQTLNETSVFGPNV